MRHALEAHHNFGQLVGHALTGAQVKRYTGPTPGIDLGLDGDEGLGARFWIGIGFLAVTWHRHAIDMTGTVLSAHHIHG